MLTTQRHARLIGEELPVDLMNTVWSAPGGVSDVLATPESAMDWVREIAPRLPQQPRSFTHWLASATPLSAHMAAYDLRRLRDAIRCLAHELTGDRGSKILPTVLDRATALEVVNSAVAGAPHWPALVWRPRSEPEVSVQGDVPGGVVAVGQIARQAVELFGGRDRQRLRACPAAGCSNYFLDFGRRGRTWCSGSCGVRVRTEISATRKKQGAEPG
ncbi:CGNR zinc finger domain-containing protein [Amycolatopsis sp. NPDC051371]|uniref:CGNR zinc finger domain-containing protein n=1 Tax=Amycolatopsis sp. NPDC051371 TaxID=3155800 RepID=UPI0034133D72